MVLRSAVCGVVALLHLGCYSTSRYDVPATMPRGKTRLTTALEVGRIRRERQDPRFGTVSDTHEHLALLPVVVGRHAVADGFELGGTVGTTRLTVETKARLLDNLAFAPGGGLLGDVLLVDAPFLAGAQLHERLTLVASPGVSWARALGKNDTVRPDGWFLRAGVGLRIAVVGPFALLPELTTMASTSGPLVTWTTAGLGFQLGPIP